MTAHGKPARSARSRIVGTVFFWASAGLFIISTLTGCGDFFASKPTELESKNLLRELETVKISPGKDIPLPAVYKQPPKILDGTIGELTDAKLFYFSRYHDVNTLAGLIDSQYVKKFMGAKNKTYPMVDFNVSTNPATNQIVVRCPTRKDAQQVLEFLEKIDVPPVQVKIDCLISEVYADHTLDWETNIQIQNLFGEKINLTGRLPGAALRDAARNSFGMDVGAVRGESGHIFDALVDLLVSRGYLKILMNPHLEVINGKTATIETDDYVPLDFVRDVENTGKETYSQNYVHVIDSLVITPHVYADGFIGIKTEAIIASKGTPEGVTQIPIITKRKVTVDENRIRQGESLVIGGIRKTEQRSVVRGVPFFKDIPIAGVLFSSKDYEERAKEVVFILTPTISSGGIPNEEMVVDIQKKHSPVRNQNSLMENIVDPLGSGVYTDLVEEEATNAEMRRLKAEMQRAHAERKAKELEEKLLQTTEEVEAQKLRADQAEAQRKTAADEAKTLAEAARKAKEDADKAKAEAETAKEDAEKAKEDAEAEIEKWIKAVQEKEKNKQNQPPPPDNK